MSRARGEFGDFQTPAPLARRVCDLLRRLGRSPASVVEPTCGTGTFLVAATRAFSRCEQMLGFDINPAHAAAAQAAAPGAVIRHADFFLEDWRERLRPLAEPILIVGNPPWVTNSALGATGGTNLPAKSNRHRMRGLDAVTGKSNFDISEWMLSRLLEALSGRSAVLAMLCKTTVARKVLRQAWAGGLSISKAAIYGIDAPAEFGAAVNACLLVCALEPGAQTSECAVFDELESPRPASAFALRGATLVADLDAFAARGHLYGTSPVRWRSGVKHGCSRVMELRPGSEPDSYVNGLGEVVALEPDLLYPMLKSSDLAKGLAPRRCMLVPQRSVGEQTAGLSRSAPRTWRYLESHADTLDARASVVFRGRPRFSVFGVGPYSFAPWKVAVSGFYKKVRFSPVPPSSGKPVVLDDTCYLLPCRSEQESRQLASLLNSPAAREFFDAFAFWDGKRPLTLSLLSCLDLDALAAECGSDWRSDAAQRALPAASQ